MPTATLTSKGQITIFKRVREHLRLAAGDRVDLIFDDDGTVRVQPLRGSARALYGVLGRSDRRAPHVAEIDDAIADSLADDLERSRS